MTSETSARPPSACEMPPVISTDLDLFMIILYRIKFLWGVWSTNGEDITCNQHSEIIFNKTWVK